MKKSTWIAFSCLIVLSVLYFVFKQDTFRKGIREIDLSSFKESKIDEIDVIGQESLRLTKKDHNWFVEVSVKDKKKLVPADNQEVKQTLEMLLKTHSDYFVTSLSEKHGDFGVGDGQGIHVEIKGADGQKINFVIGNSVQGSSGQYVRLLPGPDVFVVKSSLGRLSRTDADVWRNHLLLQLKPADVSKIQFGNVLLERDKSKNTFALAASMQLPVGYRFSEDKAQQMVRTFVNLRAVQFVDDDELAKKLRSDLLESNFKVVAHTAEGKEDTLLFSPKDYQGQVYAMVQGHEEVYEIAPYVVTQFREGLDTLRDLKLLSFDEKKVNHLSIRKGQQVLFSVHQSDGAWKLEEPKVLPKKYDFDADRVNALLSQLSSMYALRASSESPASLGATLVSVLIEELDGKKVELQIKKQLPQQDKSAPSENYVTVSGDKNVYVISHRDMEYFASGLDLMKKVQEPNMPKEQAGGFESLPPDVQRQLMQAMRQQQAN